MFTDKELNDKGAFRFSEQKIYAGRWELYKVGDNYVNRIQNKIEDISVLDLGRDDSDGDSYFLKTQNLFMDLEKISKQGYLFRGRSLHWDYAAGVHMLKSRGSLSLKPAPHE